MTIDERVKQLRKLMRNNGIDCWYVNGTDPHQSEYVCPRWRSRAWISGFTGSAGTVVVTRTEALLWVDSRYYVQGAKQIEGSCYQLMKQEWEDTPSPIDWIKTNLKKGKVVGIDQETISVSDYQRMSGCLAEKGITLATMPDLLDQIWTDRPAVPDSKVVEVEKRYAGLSRAEKFSQVRNAMEEKGCTYYLVCAIDDIAWMTNLRGDDIKYNKNKAQIGVLAGINYKFGNSNGTHNFKIVKPYCMVHYCAELGLDSLKIFLGIQEFTFIIFHDHEFVLPFYDVTCLNIAHSLLPEVWQDLLPNDVVFGTPCVMSKSRLHVLSVQIIEFGKCHFHRSCLILKEALLPIFGLSSGFEASLYFPFTLTGPVFIIEACEPGVLIFIFICWHLFRSFQSG